MISLFLNVKPVTSMPSIPWPPVRAILTFSMRMLSEPVMSMPSPATLLVVVLPSVVVAVASPMIRFRSVTPPSMLLSTMASPVVF